MRSDVIERLHQHLRENDVEAALRLLRDRGLSKIQSIKALTDTGRFGLTEAKALVHESVAWRDVRQRDLELHEALEEEITPPLIRSIVGEPLSGIAFIQDFVELHFDGRILRALANPSVVVGGNRYRFPNEGSRDALCLLIGTVVEDIVIEDGSSISVCFPDGAVIAIPLGITSRTGPEAAHYVPGIDQPIEVW